MYLPREPSFSDPKKTKNPNPSPIGNRFGFFLFGGRGWIARAAHLKKPLRGFFAAGTDSGGRCCSNPPAAIPLICFYKTETPVPGSDTGVLGGRGWIRTTEAEKQQIYSLSPLATREHAHILFTVRAGLPVYLTTAPGICQVFAANYFAGMRAASSQKKNTRTLNGFRCLKWCE